MPKKGKTNNPHGRPKGVVNKITKELRAKLKIIIDDELDALPGLMAGVETKERLEILVRLLPYVLPKVEAVNPHFGEPMDETFDLFVSD